MGNVPTAVKRVPRPKAQAFIEEKLEEEEEEEDLAVAVEEEEEEEECEGEDVLDGRKADEGVEEAKDEGGEEEEHEEDAEHNEEVSFFSEDI